MVAAGSTKHAGTKEAKTETETEEGESTNLPPDLALMKMIRGQSLRADASGRMPLKNVPGRLHVACRCNKAWVEHGLWMPIFQGHTRFASASTWCVQSSANRFALSTYYEHAACQE